MDNRTVGTTIAQLRNGKHLTQAELGNRLGISFQAVSKWERGETLPDISLLPALADALETTIDYILRCGEAPASFKGKVKIADMIEGLEHLKQFGECLGKDNQIYRCAIEGINAGLNTDIEPAFTNDFVFEAFVAEAVLQQLLCGMYVDVTDVMHSFKHEHFRTIVLDAMKKRGLM